TKVLHLVKAKGGMPEAEREHYAALEHHAGECLQCGACEGRCPFGVKVIENMQEAARVFGL
ncbi:MAG: 4Fe-4S dicluster domain-containing protein, partial [Clostridia bacterium]|nr:4Fe-4S dicluster domain-containing protein [Clostridia bacterium]